MCIAVFLWKAHPLYPLLLLLNRDEYQHRPAKPLSWWEGGLILGGRDCLAGGTWLACSRHGRIAFITNVRELHHKPDAKSRGDLPLRFLEGEKNPTEFAEELAREADLYNGFNLIIADLCSKTMVYITNRSKEDKLCVTEVSPGIHVLSNARLDSPWPKALRLEHNFKGLADTYGEGEVPIKEMADKLMRNTDKDDESVLPHIYATEWEYVLSSIFVEAETPKGRYGTRSTSALSVKTTGDVYFHERYFEKEMWKEETVTYQIDDMKK